MAALMWFFALFGSQLYLFSSGTPQPAHLVTVTLFINYLFRKDLLATLAPSAALLAPLILFVFYALFVNFSWAVVMQSSMFFLNSLFWVFSLLIVVTVVYALKISSVRQSLRWAAFFGVIFLLGLWLLNFGRYNYGSRFNGYFNDPNQMAFWVLCATAVFLNLSPRINKFIFVVLGVAASAAIFSTLSRSALLGIGFILFGICLRFVGYAGSVRSDKKLTYLFLGLVLFPIVVYLTLSTELASGVVERFMNTDFNEQADVRGYGRIINYPEYLFLGAGQGLDYRFDSANEIHSSWVGVLFYYGFVGFSIFSWFMFQIFRRLDLPSKFVFLAPVLYGLSTYGLRSPIFWFFIASAIYSIQVNAASANKKS